MKKIKNIIIRRILNSTGGDAYEAEVELEDGFVGIASSPVAIEPGRREIIILKVIWINLDLM